MTFTITAQGIITAAAVAGALVALAGYFIKAHNWVNKQNGQDAKLEALEKQHTSDIKALKSELTLLTYGQLACLKGLKEQGCNGPVTEAINKIEKHLNEKAHE